MHGNEPRDDALYRLEDALNGLEFDQEDEGFVRKVLEDEKRGPLTPEQWRKIREIAERLDDEDYQQHMMSKDD